MSELKAHKAYNRWIDEEMPTPNDDLICNEVYLKSEADKVIAELKADYREACGRLQTANLIKDEQLAATRHHKYKRCLAMANWCCDACDKWMMRKAKAIALGKDGVKEYYQAKRKLFLFMRWQTRWLKIAEQFKEEK